MDAVTTYALSTNKKRKRKIERNKNKQTKKEAEANTEKKKISKLEMPPKKRQLDHVKKHDNVASNRRRTMAAYGFHRLNSCLAVCPK